MKCKTQQKENSTPVEDEGFGHPAAQSHAHPVHEFLRGEELPVCGSVLCKTQRLAGARQDGNLPANKPLKMILNSKTRDFKLLSK
jgi:hypothetical protein